MNDIIPDCYNGKDEFENDSQKYLVKSKTCKDITAIPCFPADTKCFYLYELCIYEVHDHLGPGFLKPCRNGKHLANCSAALCPHHFKCQNYYCIPYRYICDGKQDCPLGDDEHSCIDRMCVGLFKCRNSGICIHYYDFENGVIDCPEGDDELSKDISPCPFNCSCQSFTVSCTNISGEDIPDVLVGILSQTGFKVMQKCNAIFPLL